MSRLSRAGGSVRIDSVEVRPGERILAQSQGPDGVVIGTRDAIYLSRDAEGAVRYAWEQVSSADWDSQSQRLRVVGVAEWGEPAPTHIMGLGEAGLLLQLVRERVTASMVLQRHVPLGSGRQARILARRAPNGRGDISWFVEYDSGLEPDDPSVVAAVSTALAAARSDVGCAQ